MVSALDMFARKNCLDLSPELYYGLVAYITIPIFFNFVSIIIILLIIREIRKLKNATEAVISSTHWLARTAVRVGMGDSMQQALAVYAAKNNLQNLIPKDASEDKGKKQT